MTDNWLIVGLGNPGAEYAHNRHNVGQMVLDELATRVGAGFKSSNSRAQVLEGRLGIGGPRVVLAKPLSFMNVSGGPVSALAKFFDIDPGHVIAVHRELNERAVREAAPAAFEHVEFRAFDIDLDDVGNRGALRVAPLVKRDRGDRQPLRLAPLAQGRAA